MNGISFLFVMDDEIFYIYVGCFLIPLFNFNDVSILVVVVVKQQQSGRL